MAKNLRDRIRRRAGSPAVRLLFACLIGLVLLIPLMMVKGLVADRQQQAQTAQEAITSGWGGSQVLAGPVLVVPFRTTQVENVTDNGKPVTRVSEVEKLVYISPVYNEVHTTISPKARSKSIYRTVVFTAQVNGYATFKLPDGVTFVHLADHNGEGSPLTGLAAFKAFQAGIGERCDEPPVVSELSEVGSFDW